MTIDSSWRPERNVPRPSPCTSRFDRLPNPRKQHTAIHSTQLAPALQPVSGIVAAVLAAVLDQVLQKYRRNTGRSTGRKTFHSRPLDASAASFKRAAARMQFLDDRSVSSQVRSAPPMRGSTPAAFSKSTASAASRHTADCSAPPRLLRPPARTKTPFTFPNSSKKVMDRFNAAIQIRQMKLLIRRMQIVVGQTEPHHHRGNLQVPLEIPRWNDPPERINMCPCCLFKAFVAVLR